MKAKILNVRGLKPLDRKTMKVVNGGHNGSPHASICGVKGYPPCVLK